MKRVRPAPMGRAFRVVKRTAHLTVQVAERPVKIARGRSEARRRRARGRSAATRRREDGRRPRQAAGDAQEGDEE